MSAAEKRLVWFLRLTAVFLIIALGAAIMPYAWMNAIHGWLGLGTLADEPVVGYLARSLSALYAFLGAISWFLSRDVRRHVPLLRFVVPMTALYGALLVAIDIAVELPLWWSLSEALSLLVWATTLWCLVRHVQEPRTK
jgi:hypothetical protein